MAGTRSSSVRSTPETSCSPWWRGVAGPARAPPTVAGRVRRRPLGPCRHLRRRRGRGRRDPTVCRAVRGRHGLEGAELLQPPRLPDGFEEAAAKVQELYLARQHRDAAAAVPLDFIDATSLIAHRSGSATVSSATQTRVSGRSRRAVHRQLDGRLEVRAHQCRAHGLDWPLTPHPPPNPTWKQSLLTTLPNLDALIS
jgi:hypothetical protein